MAELKIQVKADITGIEKLIDQLKELQTYKMYEGADQTLVDLDDVVKIFADHVEAEVAQPQWRCEWIPCSERFPRVDEAVLATTAWNDITLAWRIGIDKWFIHEGNTNATTEDLIAWMPLPEPYKERREE